jgi:hypothetical protein
MKKSSFPVLKTFSEKFGEVFKRGKKSLKIKRKD